MQEFNLDDDFDFGFTSVNEDVFNASEQQINEAAKSAAYEKANKIYETILPLLDNLAKDADKNAYIHWPDRGTKIAQFKKKLLAIVNS